MSDGEETMLIVYGIMGALVRFSFWLANRADEQEEKQRERFYFEGFAEMPHKPYGWQDEN